MHREQYVTARPAHLLFRVPESDVRVFPRSAGHQRGPVGVAIATGPDVTTARDRVRQMSGALQQWWS